MQMQMQHEMPLQAHNPQYYPASTSGYMAALPQYSTLYSQPVGSYPQPTYNQNLMQPMYSAQPPPMYYNMPNLPHQQPQQLPQYNYSPVAPPQNFPTINTNNNTPANANANANANVNTNISTNTVGKTSTSSIGGLAGVAIDGLHGNFISSNSLADGITDSSNSSVGSLKNLTSVASSNYASVKGQHNGVVVKAAVAVAERPRAETPTPKPTTTTTTTPPEAIISRYVSNWWTSRKTKKFLKVSERSERALKKTSILAMIPTKWLQTVTHPLLS